VGCGCVLDREVERAVHKLLRAVWLKADWKKIARQRSRYDVFAHKVKAAACQETVPKFLEKLCRSLSLQSVRVPPSLIRILDGCREEVLAALREETIFHVLMATEVDADGNLNS